MNILFVLENYYPHVGGVEVLFKNLAEGLAKKGHNVEIVTHKLKETKNFEIINKVKIHRVNCLHSRYLFTFLSIPKIFKLAKKADIIHTTTFNAAFPSWFVSKIINKKVIITVHEVWVDKWHELTEMNWFSALIHNILEKMIYLLRFDKYVAVSESTRKQLLSIGIEENKTCVAYNGVDYKLWNPKRYDRNNMRKKLEIENNFVCLFSGRPGTSKGLEYLVKAVPILGDRIRKFKLIAIISKDKTYEKRYNSMINMIKKIDKKGIIKVIDPVKYKDLPYYVRAADCIVVPSLSEGFGFAVAEACAIGTPVVATNTTSIPEVISNKFILVKPKDENSIAEGIIRVFNKKSDYKPLKRFKIEDNTRSYLKVYEDTIS
jgi:glycosyltransferase involved in cell wall biosynthesis